MASDLQQSVLLIDEPDFRLKRDRFAQMRRTARRRGLSVPEWSELEALLPKDMKCPHCGAGMVWKRRDDQCRVITLQHDRSGAHRLLCFRCNSQHQADQGDSFYEVPPGHRRCFGCREIKPFEAFWINRATVNKRLARCIPCAKKVLQQRRQVNPERDREMAKIYDARRRAKKRASRLILSS